MSYVIQFDVDFGETPLDPKGVYHTGNGNEGDLSVALRYTSKDLATDANRTLLGARFWRLLRVHGNCFLSSLMTPRVRSLIFGRSSGGCFPRTMFGRHVLDGIISDLVRFYVGVS